MFRVPCLIFYVQYLMWNVQCPIFIVWCLMSHVPVIAHFFRFLVKFFCPIYLPIFRPIFLSEFLSGFLSKFLADIVCPTFSPSFRLIFAVLEDDWNDRGQNEWDEKVVGIVPFFEQFIVEGFQTET